MTNALLPLLTWAILALAPQAGQVEFAKTVLDTRFVAEGVAVGDENRDGGPDIRAGKVW